MTPLTLTRRLQDFGKLARSEAERDLYLFNTIDIPLDHLSFIENALHRLTALANKMAKEVVSVSQALNPSGSLVTAYEKIRDTYEQAYERLQAKCNHAAEVQADADLISAYEVTLDALARMHNAINALCWAIGEHDADFDEVLAGTFSNPAALFKAIGI